MATPTAPRATLPTDPAARLAVTLARQSSADRADRDARRAARKARNASKIWER